MPLGTEVGLGAGDIVLDGTKLRPQKGAQQPPLPTFAVYGCRLACLLACVRIRCRENLRVQAEASMPASCSHLAILFLAKILHTKTGYDFWFLATVP